MDSRDHVDRGGRVNGGMRFAYSTLRVEQSRPRYRARNIVGRNKTKPHCAATSPRRSRLCCCYSPHAHDPFPSRTGRGEMGVQVAGSFPPLPAIADFSRKRIRRGEGRGEGQPTPALPILVRQTEPTFQNTAANRISRVVRQRPARLLGTALRRSFLMRNAGLLRSRRTDQPSHRCRKARRYSAAEAG